MTSSCRRTCLPVVALLALATACSNSNDEQADGVPASLTITATDSVLSPDETGQYTAEVLDADGHAISGAVSWSVTNSILASIDASGVLTTTEAGLGTIYVVAEAGDIRDSVALRITSSWSGVSVGESEVCARDIQRRIWCWGVSRGTTQPVNGLLPSPVESDKEFSTVEGGIGAACGVVNGDGTGYCWGLQVFGNLGIGNVSGSTPQLITGGFLYDHVVLGREHGCGLSIPNQIVCWGKNAHGEVGDSVAGTGGTFGHAPTAVVGGHSWTQVVAKDYRSCGLTVAHRVYCWGADYGGEAGWPVAVTGDQNFPVAIESDHDYGRIVMGAQFQCGLTVDAGVLECWGNTTGGQLGNGVTAPGLQRLPQPVSGDHSFGEISAGEAHACAIDGDYKAWCWGTGALGHATLETSAIPVEVAGNHQFILISAGSTQSCGVTVGAALYCWGTGNLGDGTGQPSLTPVRVRDP